MNSNPETAAPTPTAPKLPPAKAVYFDQVEGQPVVEHLIFALDGVCSALDAEQMNFEDEEQLNRISNLSCAARILARQLEERITSKPPTSKQLETARKVQADWAAVREQARAVQ